MARKIFYNRRTRRRAIAVAGVLASAVLLFSAGVYAGVTYPALFSLASLMGGETAPIAVAAAEF